MLFSGFSSPLMYVRYSVVSCPHKSCVRNKHVCQVQHTILWQVLYCVLTVPLTFTQCWRSLGKIGLSLR